MPFARLYVSLYLELSDASSVVPLSAYPYDLMGDDTLLLRS